jgi:hypothetical protein
MDINTHQALTKQQNKRLRFYFSQGGRIYKSELDGIDLDLIGLKLIEINTSENSFSSSNKLRLTEAGLDAVHQHRQSTLATQNIHHSLGHRFSAYLRSQGRITWENIEFRNQIYNKDIDYHRWQCVRPDVFSILPSLQMKYANPCVHEIKISRSDFLSDMAKPEKYQAYQLMSEATYYVAPEGIIEKEELPAGLGLIIETKENQFKLIKKAKKRKMELQPHHYLNMIIKPGQYPDS